MKDRRDVFFYGLFMDEQLLRDKGCTPIGARPASLPGFALQIGARATLVPDRNATAHGILASLSQQELDVLYADPGVRDYRPESVTVDVDGERVAALCYIAPASAGQRNPEYIARLRGLAQSLGLPPDYVASIR